MTVPSFGELLESVIGRREPPSDGGSRSLSILLTNDDGWTAPGIQTARGALVEAGHSVRVVAPEENQSGTGARIAFSGLLQVTRRADDTISVGGSPAEATEFGLSVVFADRAPDLVVSGINAGQNVGAIVIHSGTVGAVVTALADRVPAIAISTEIDLATAAAPYGQAAGFLVALVDELAAGAGGGPVLPDGLGLNVNYPYVEPGEEVGVCVARIGRGFIDVTYHGGEMPTSVGTSSVYQVGFDLSTAEPDPDADTAALARNHITISPITPSYNAPRG